MTNFRFLHTADIHLDSPLRGLDGQEGDIAQRIRSAPREAFENLVEYALREQVDFVVIAGDLYDGDWRDFRTGLFFVRQMGRLNAAEIPVFLLYGNHDAESRTTKALELPGNVHVFRGRKPHTFTLDEIGVALHGQSFRDKSVTENLVPGYPSPRKRAVQHRCTPLRARWYGWARRLRPDERGRTRCQGLRLLGARPRPPAAGAPRAAAGGVPWEHSGTARSGNGAEGRRGGYGARR